MTTLHEPVAVPRSHLDALDRLNEGDRAIAEQLREEYFDATKRPKGFSLFRGPYSGDLKYAIMSEGDSFPYQLKRKLNCRESRLTIDTTDEKPLEHLTNLTVLMNDHFANIGYGRPFKSVTRHEPSDEYPCKKPYLIFVIHVDADKV